MASRHAAALIARAEADYILGCSIKSIKQAGLEPAVEMTMGRFGRFETLRREAADLRQALEDRKVIERAKGLLMKRAALDEPEAFRRLQRRLASAKGPRLVAIAQMILVAEEAVPPSEKNS